MNVKICPVGGYDEVGKNMTAVKVGEETVILDMGFHLPSLVKYEESGHSRQKISNEHLIKLGIIPDDRVLDSWKPSVKAIVSSHAHFDHVGAVPHMCGAYQAPVLGTPFTTEFLRMISEDNGLLYKNPVKTVNLGSSYKVSENIEIEFIGTTHSTPQSAMVALHTKKGVILYTNDFKFDDHPVIGKKPDYARLKELGEEGVFAVVADSLYSGCHQKTPSERIARELLKDTMLSAEAQDNPIIITCFSSNIARLKSIAEFGKKLNRKITFLGRSLLKYTNVAKNIGLIDFSKGAEIIGNAERIQKKFARIEKEGPENYVIVCTGGQGEQNSVLSRMLHGIYHFKFGAEDSMIFSNKTIPVSPNIENREHMEKKLESHGVKIYKDVHVSGHASREDLRELIKLINPQHIIPGHGHHKLVKPMEDLAVEMGFTPKHQVHLCKNGKTLTLE
ncbi:MAG: RNase J family beta-CASP ribonuclease [Nanoarchaeota archaeon]